MTLPIRRARRRRRLGVVDLVGRDGRGDRLAPEIELGWNNLLDELRDAGWPARSPDGDQKPYRPHECGDHCNDPCEDADGNPIAYSDRTGNLISGYDAKIGDLLALQDHLHTLNSSLRALHLIANRHRPTLSPAIPGCTVTTCDEPVESRTMTNGQRAYLGMEQIAGHWVAKPGCTPTCNRHRWRRQRDDVA
jgi:hypothetical protein